VTTTTRPVVQARGACANRWTPIRRPSKPRTDDLHTGSLPTQPQVEAIPLNCKPFADQAAAPLLPTAQSHTIADFAHGWLLGILLCSQPVAARTIAVPPGGDLQAAIMNAQAGDTIELTAGAVYAGNFTLTDHGGGDFVTIRTAESVGQPEAGSRVSPDHAQLLAKIRTSSNQPAIQTAPNAHTSSSIVSTFMPTPAPVASVESR
jgi:hypothetical protein